MWQCVPPPWGRVRGIPWAVTIHTSQSGEAALSQSSSVSSHPARRMSPSLGLNPPILSSGAVPRPNFPSHMQPAEGISQRGQISVPGGDHLDPPTWSEALRDLVPALLPWSAFYLLLAGHSFLTAQTSIPLCTKLIPAPGPALAVLLA